MASTRELSVPRAVVKGCAASAPAKKRWEVGFLKRYGWLSKLWSLLRYPKYKVPYDNKDPKRDHKFDNHPYVGGFR